MNQLKTASKQNERPIEHQVLLDWWKGLADHRGDRAALRRSSSIEKVMFNPSFHRLWRKLKGTRWNQPERVALIAALAARVKTDDQSGSFAAHLGSPPPGRDKAAFSGLRFRRLLQSSQLDDLLQGCSRAIAMSSGRTNLTNLAESMYWWGDGIRKHWAFDYYDANPSAD